MIMNDQKFLSSKINDKVVENSGMWSNIMCEMTLLCLSNPESPMKLLLFPYNVKAKFYPLLLFVLFTLTNKLRIDLEVISGIIYGLFYYRVLKGGMLLL